MTIHEVPRVFDESAFALRVRDEGPSDGPTALLLHGFPQHSGMWDACLPGLHALGLRTIAVDQRGYSPAPQPEDAAAYVLPELVADALAVLDHVGAEDALVVGHDWGAAVAWSLAASAPLRVRGLVAASIPHPRAFGQALKSDPEQQRLSAYITLLRDPEHAEPVLLADDARRLREFFRGSALDHAAVDAYVRPLLTPGALRGPLAWYRAMAGPEFAAVGRVAVPTVYVSAEHDLGVSRAAAEGCADWVDAAYRRVDVAGGTHWIPDEHPEVVVEAVRSLL